MYTAFNLLKTSELTLLRRSFFFPWYELTDGQSSYGKLSYQGFFRRTGLIEMANASYLVEFEGFFSRTLRISTNGELTGKIQLGLFSNAALMMHDGFEAEFKFDSIWNRTYTWHTTRFGEIIKLKEAFLSFSKAVTITVDPNSANISMVPLLCFLGSHLIILRRRRKRAAR
jgi:hypothetical protein